MALVQERYTSFTITIKLDDGEDLVVREFGVSEWHAKDKAHSKYLNIQPKLACYVVVKPLINTL